MRAAELARFKARISIDPKSGCWLWTGYVRPDGYGTFTPVGQTARAHRVFFEHVHGPIPTGRDLDHLCRVRCCVRPDHLRVATRRENLLAPGSLSMARRHADKTCCPQGHAYDAVDNRGARICLKCDRERHRERYHRRREEMTV